MKASTQMQLFGYPSDTETEEPMQLSEVSVVVSVKMMRELASFLVSCADEMDAQKKPYGPDTHFHLRDFLKEEMDADLIVVPVRE
jgi:hypothetical protein